MAVYNRQDTIVEYISGIRDEVDSYKAPQFTGSDVVVPKETTTDLDYDVETMQENPLSVWQNFAVVWTADHQTSPWATLRYELFVNDPSTPAPVGANVATLASLDPAASFGGDIWWVCYIAAQKSQFSKVYAKIYVHGTDTGSIEVILT